MPDADSRAERLARALAAAPAAEGTLDPAVARLVDALGPGLDEALSSRGTDVRGVLRVRSFRTLWMALALSSLGDWLGLLAQTSFAAALGAHTGGQSGSAYAIGGVLLVRLLPAILFGPFAGAVADRFDRRFIMVTSDFVRVGVFVSIPLVHTLWWLNAATFLSEFFGLFWIPAKEASVPNLLRRDQLESANTLSLITTYGTAPIAAGLFALLASTSRGLTSIFGSFGTHPTDLAFYADALSFLVGGLTALSIREISAHALRTDPSSETSEHKAVFGSLVRDVGEGWRFVGSQRLVRGLVLGIVGAFGGVGTVVACGRLYVGDLGGGDSAYGLIFASVFIGLVLGMIGGRIFLADFPRRRLFGIAISSAGASMAVVSVLPNLVVAIGGVVFVGFWAGLAWVTGYTLLGGEVADEIRARTFAIVQTLVRITLFLVLAVAPFLVGVIGFHRIQVSTNNYVRADGATIVMFGGGLLAVVAGVVALRQMDDRRGVSLWRDLITSVRRSRPVKITHPGLFIAVEGGEGAGKTTQLELLQAWLSGAGHEVVVTREPGATPAGRRIRSLLLDPEASVAPAAELLLYAADRAQHVAEVVLPALQRKAVVITDRYSDSTRAYQGAGRGISPDLLETLILAATGGLEPDIVVLLDVSPQVGLGRAAGRGAGVDRIEAESVAFHRSVRQRFLELALAEPGRWIVVNAELPPDEVARAVRAGLVQRLGVDRLVAVPAEEARV